MRTPPRLMPALLTPFTRSGDLDPSAHRHNLTSLVERGIQGFVIGGSTGEGPYLEPGNRADLLGIARDTLGRRPFLIGGIAAETERLAMTQLTEVTEAGADAVLVLTPTALVRNRHHYVKDYYTSIADRSPLPVFLYSVPGVTGYELPDSTVARLAEHPNIVGIKDSGGDPVRMQRLVASTPDGFFLYTGSTQALTLAIAAGARGAITASTNYLPGLALATVAAARRSPKQAASLQRQLSDIARAVDSHGIPGVKAAAAEVGLRPGYPRAPLRPLKGKLARQLGELVRSAT